MSEFSSGGAISRALGSDSWGPHCIVPSHSHGQQQVVSPPLRVGPSRDLNRDSLRHPCNNCCQNRGPSPPPLAVVLPLLPCGRGDRPMAVSGCAALTASPFRYPRELRMQDPITGLLLNLLLWSCLFCGPLPWFQRFFWGFSVLHFPGWYSNTFLF